MTTSIIGPTTERERAIAVVHAAFRDDPISRWVYPDDAAYEAAFPRIINAMSGRAFDRGSAYATADLGGVALWLPPGVASDEEAMGEVMAETVAPELMDDLVGFSEVMATMHLHEPHWYLPMIGVDPACQGRGLGDALMAHALARCDRDGVAAYLESSNPRNISLYRRHGFEPVGEIRTDTSPTLVPMLRKRRA